MLTIKPILEQDLIHYWQDIREDIRKVERKSKVDYTPLDILKLLKKKQAYAAILNYEGKHIGSLILRPIVEEFSGKNIMHVWILAMNQPKNGDGDLLDFVWDFVKDQSEQAGMDSIQLISDRPGWGRRLKKYGFQESQYRAYVRELDHE